MAGDAIIAPGLTPFQRGLKQVSLALVRAVGGVEAAALFCRIGKSQLSDATNFNKPESWLPIDVIADLEAVAGVAPVTAYLARHQGRVLHALPDAGAASTAGNWNALLAQLAREGGEVMASVATHAANGLTAAKVRKSGLIGDLDDVLLVVVQMRAAAVAIENEG